MFFIQIAQVSGSSEVSAGIASTSLFGLPMSNLNDVGSSEDSKVHCMRLGNNLTVVTMQHGELDLPKYEERMHPLQHKSFFSGYEGSSNDDRSNNTIVSDSTTWTRNATLSFGTGSSFSGPDVLSYASGSAIAGGGARVQIGSTTANDASPSAHSTHRMSASADRAGPSLSSAGMGGGGILTADRSSAGLGGGAMGSTAANAGEKNVSATVVNGVPIDPTIHEDPSVHWTHMGMFSGVFIDLRPSLKAHLTETIYGLADPRKLVDDVSCPYTTMYYHNTLAEIAKETFYLGEEHEKLILEQRARHNNPHHASSSHSNNTVGCDGQGSDWDFVMGNTTTRGSGASVTSPTQSTPSFVHASPNNTNTAANKSSVCLTAPPAVEAEIRLIEGQLEDSKAQTFIITIGSDMGYSATTLLRVAAIASEMATFLGYPNNEKHLRTVVKYMRNLMLEGNLSFMQQSRERLQKSAPRYDAMLRDATLEFSEQITNAADSMTAGARHPVYSSIMMGDKLVAETSPNFAVESLRYNNQTKSEVWASDKYLVQLLAAAYYSIPTLVGDQITPKEWRIAQLERGLAKFGINRMNVTRPATRAFMIKYLKMMSSTVPVTVNHLSSSSITSSPLVNNGGGSSVEASGNFRASVASGGSSASAASSQQQNQQQPVVGSSVTGGAPPPPFPGPAELRIGDSETPVPKKDKASEENSSSIYACYFDELLRLCDPNIRIMEEEEDSSSEEEGEAEGLGGGREGHRLSSNDLFSGGQESPSTQSLSIPRHASGLLNTTTGGGGGGGGRTSANNRFSVYDPRNSNVSNHSGADALTRESTGVHLANKRAVAPVVVDDSLREAMSVKSIRASMRLAASHGELVRTNQGLPAHLSLKRSMKIAKNSRKTVDNIIPKCAPYHDPCRFLPPIRSSEATQFDPKHTTLDRPDVLFTAIIEGILLRGPCLEHDAALQLDFFHAVDDDAYPPDQGEEECPRGYSVAFLYSGLTTDERDTDDEDKILDKEAELKQLSLYNDKALNDVYQMTVNAFKVDLSRAQWLTSPTVESYGIPGLIHFACIDRRQNTCVAANFDAAIRNASDPEQKIGNRMLHDMMVQGMSKAHELMAMGFSEGLWGHLGVQFFYCVGLLPSENRIMVQQQAASVNASAAASRAGSPEATNPYGSGGGFGKGILRKAHRGGNHFNRSNFTQSVFVDAQTISALTNSSFAGSMYSASGGRPSVAIDASQARGALLFPERTKLPLCVVENLLYRPYLIPDKSESAVVEFFGLFVGAMSPSEVCDAVEMLWGKIFE